MIPFASQRGGGQDLATHLQNEYDNEIAEVLDIRGAVANDLHGAFKEWEAQAQALTRCEKYLYSLSVNPDPAQGPLTREQYMDYIARAEEALGLAEQPRAIVFHTKFGREHCHGVWSRIDAEEGKAIHLAFDRDKLMRVTRAFARDHGLDLPEGYDKSRQAGQLSLYELEQMRQTSLGKADHMRLVTEAWQASDDAKSFVQALAERGYMLATGKRPYLVVDLYGNVNALPKLIDDKSIRTKDIRAFLEKDFPPESLPSAEDAQQLVAAHRKLIERSLSEDSDAGALEELKHQQRERRAPVERERLALAQRQQEARLAQAHAHAQEREALRHGHMETLREVRAARERDKPTGLAAFLGKVTGVALIRKALQRREDARRLEAYRTERKALKDRQGEEAGGLEKRFRLQTMEADRQVAALEKIERRELKAFMRDQRADHRIRARGDEDHPPSLVALLQREARTGSEARGVAPDLMRSFEQSKQAREAEPPDLMAAFDRAARGRRKGRQEDTARSDLDGLRSPGDSPLPERDGKPLDR